MKESSQEEQCVGPQTSKASRTSVYPGANPEIELGKEAQESSNNEALMEDFQQGHLPAFEKLLHRHQRSVYRFVLRYTGSREVAEDLVQDVFLRLFANAKSFEKRSRFTTWLYTIARNLCIDHLRKKRHRNALSLDQPVNPGSESEVCLMDQVKSNRPPPDEQAHSQRLRAHLAAAIANLTEEQREVFVMREEGGLPFEEIAKVVKAPLNTVKSRMRYALQNLKNYLQSQGVGC